MAYCIFARPLDSSRCQRDFIQGLTKGSGWFQRQVVIPEVRVLIDQLDRIPEIRDVFESYQFGWIAQPPGYYGPAIIEEFYFNYVASLLNSIQSNHSKRLKKQLACRLSPQAYVMVHGVRVDSSKTTIHRFLFSLDYRSPPNVLFMDRHLKMMDEGRMSDSTSRAALLKWIAARITIQGVDVPWCTNPRVSITKASLNFIAKFWWSVVRTRLRPTNNDNILQPSYASLVACLMAKFGINVGWIIATDMGKSFI